MYESLIVDIINQSEYSTFMKYRKWEPEKKKDDKNKVFKENVDRIQAEKNKI